MTKTRIGDIVLAVLVVAITAMLLVPLPTTLIDILIVVNLSVALLLLLVGLYMPNSLSLLAFPTLLLLTTLFRLSLNVASSRLILSQADAGRVIHAFGTFLIQGEVVVGIIIFTIVTIVNFIVIAKGSARVSEVSARFVLDALPGKQMTIDSDLRAGFINPEQARQKREELRKESQLFGAMDGAMKFVQGDAIAGIFIIITNIVGGLYRGVASGMNFGDAVQTYTILTIGDGLVSQIPALLISICAGIVVTRVSSSENATLGSEITTQLFSRPLAVIASGGLLLVLGALPYIPFLPFAGVGIVFIVTGAFLQRRQSVVFGSSQGELGGGNYKGTAGFLPAPSDESEEDEVIEIFIDTAVLYRLYRMNTQRYEGWWNDLQRDFYETTGMRLPRCVVKPDDRLGAASYRVTFCGAILDENEVLLDNVLVELNPDHAASFGIEVNQEIHHPRTGCRVFWSYLSPSLRRITEAAGIRTIDFFEYIGVKIADYFVQHPEELFSAADVYDLLKSMEKKHPGFVSEGLGKNFLGVPRLTELCQELLRQGLAMRDFGSIVEAVSGYCAANRVEADDEADIDLREIVEYVRVYRKRHLLPTISSMRRTVKVFTLSTDVEVVFEGAHLDVRSRALAMDPDIFETLRRAIDTLSQPIRERGVLPVAVLCSPAVRYKVGVFLESCGSIVRAIAVDELEPTTRLERVGVWQMS